MSTIVRVTASNDILAVLWDDDLEQPPRSLGIPVTDLTVELVARAEFTEAGRTYSPPPDPEPAPDPEPDPIEQLQAELDATNAVLAGVLNLLGTFQGGA